MNVRKLKSILICLLLTAFGSVIWTEFFLSQRNVLAFKAGWHLYHREFLNPNIVTYPILTSNHILQGGRLKSDHELGIIRLLSDDPMIPEEGKIWFRLEDGGFVDLIFNSSPKSFKALRLSRSKFYPSGVYESDSTEKFLNFRALDIHPDSGLNTATFRQERLELNGKEISVPDLVFLKGEVGVQITPAHAEVLFAKFDHHILHFFPDGNHWSLYPRHFLILAVLVFLLGFIPRFQRNKIAFLIGGAGMLFLMWDYLIGFQTNLKPAEVTDKFRALDAWWKPDHTTLEEKLKMLKKGDSDTVMFLCRKAGCEPTPIHVPLPQKKGHRIVIFGGSQSKYALVRNFEESIHFRFDQLLRRSMPDVETINISAPGQFQDRITAFGKYLPNVDMDTIIIESKVAEMEYPAIRRFLEECKKRNVRIILLRTPQNTFNYDDAALSVVIPELLKGLDVELEDIPNNYLWMALRNVTFIKEAQKDFGFIFLDPNRVFLHPEVIKSGQLFWDRTHMTIHGQEVFAKWLTEEYLKLN